MICVTCFYAKVMLKCYIMFHTNPFHMNSLPARRDKYEPDVKEYWIDIGTSGTFENEDEELIVDRTQATGQASSFDLGLPAGFQEQLEDGPDTDHDVDSADGDAPSLRSSRVPRRDEVEKESLFEAWNFKLTKEYILRS